MTGEQVHEIATRGLYNGVPLNGTVEETHISWVILTRKFAIKIKKPVVLSFLDFSTLELRKRQCHRELVLNRRFSDIYLSVLPICLVDGQWVIADDECGIVVDYCVVMRRMAVSKRFDNVLRKGNVKGSSVRALALEIAAFHSNARPVFTPFDITESRNTFNDIASVPEGPSMAMEQGFRRILAEAVAWSDKFLEKHADRMQSRIDEGMKRDVHGDLHAGNIFLYRKPVLFDCIEFNDEFRQIDVLYEIAFLCMDLERFGRDDLSAAFLEEYRRRFAAFRTREDDRIFVYFKCLRANVRAKVHLIQWQQAGASTEAASQLTTAAQYLNLMSRYIPEASE